MKRNILTLTSTALLALGLVFVGCRRQDAPPSSAPKATIAILNLQKHPILDAVEAGAKEALAREGYPENAEGIRYLIRTAAGDKQQIPALAAELNAQHPDVVIAISTPIAQAVVKNYRGKIVFGALTDPVSAGVISGDRNRNPNVTGTTDAVPYDAQLQLIRQISPRAKRLGILFNPGEASSQYAVPRIKAAAPGLGFEIVEGAVNSTQEVYPVALGLASRVDALLISTDNTVAAGIAGAVKVGIERKLPVFACDSGSVEHGAIGAISPGYFAIGIDTGKLAARMLKGESGLAVVNPKAGDVYLNRRAATDMGAEIPKDVEARAAKIYDEIR
ncbi:ABC transporter substrate-binding protein [Opitutus terrae]|uniref:ABC transporter substrate binding protein n=1 Tax=Opitutus terrae (strain DSM 11246 / JCM 15787 / PB90-1) TaxID=452637 RepID=B1ZRJ2_OPITP|nr:ABC transporter substrate-binding protein [Opitutus terrae]ACB77642.1 protein of unknown function DUF534 [Opitutus terrae PB90-1]